MKQSLWRFHHTCFPSSRSYRDLWPPCHFVLLERDPFLQGWYSEIATLRLPSDRYRRNDEVSHWPQALFLYDTIFTMEVLNYQWHGERIDKYLASVFPYSRSFFEHIISRGGVCIESGKPFLQGGVPPLDGWKTKECSQRPSKLIKKSYKLKTWNTIIIDNLERYLSTEMLDEAPAISITIVREADDYLIIHKPKWVLSHPNSMRDVGQPSVVGFLYHRYKNLPSVGNFVRAGLIHRLDKDTDGLMILVKTEKGLAHFKKLFQAKSESENIEAKEAVPLKKFYRATCRLTPKGQEFLSMIENKFPYILEEIVVPKVTPSVAKMGITKIMKSEELRIKNDGIVKIEVEILTGRTHQIRYHLSQHGLPIVGDVLYGADNVKNSQQLLQLTAWKLVFEDLSGEMVEVELS